MINTRFFAELHMREKFLGPPPDAIFMEEGRQQRPKDKAKEKRLKTFVLFPSSCQLITPPGLL